MIRTVDIYETPLIGVFATCTEDFVLVPRGTKPETCAILEDSLEVKAIETLVNGSVVVGALSRGNSNGFLFSYGTDTREIQKRTGVKAEILPGKLNAVGNIVLANDYAALVHPELSDSAVETIASVLEVEVYRGTIAGIKNVGMAGVVTNKGLLVHPKVTPPEKEILENIFKLPAYIGTTNYGTQMLGSGLLANSKSYLAGSDTTGPELGRIEEALGFVE
ncbi:MAG: translation initiation factor IF-6 [Methanosarcina thermophila]|jgi:translation initiation factor 6|uniref:Translation initiation factor 6 n=3 Tax=Methanosarcina thermophila TaxID=2210 RepID=A0A1I6XC65_METTE|nr:translation initiation factor IF-6 [Methanosarcina thermophila]ALK04530.1 MAG: translation initiation factor IF-6 [Methanosarcina sp. 795]AKB13184.1 Eukaryotic translation initiation factor 6 [Methanosarcina thermophila TM-1]AKB16181.1 Eukaryotic translation initiation factor 6 [Methanosarcina thermophila CHTI-55]SFT35776.1 translation initiation factor 6 (aeIF-6) [Methanosarcina thermophila]BAW28175.1 translation initiation factor 6 [Methanosarcina thermophila]